MIKIKQGEDYRKILCLQDAESQEPIDLTGCTAFSQMRDKPNGSLLATAVCSIEAEMGEVTVFYAGSDLAEIAPGEYGYDVWIVDDQEEKHPIYTTRFVLEGKYTDNME